MGTEATDGEFIYLFKQCNAIVCGILYDVCSSVSMKKGMENALPLLL